MVVMCQSNESQCCKGLTRQAWGFQTLSVPKEAVAFGSWENGLPYQAVCSPLPSLRKSSSLWQQLNSPLFQLGTLNWELIHRCCCVNSLLTIGSMLIGNGFYLEVLINFQEIGSEFHYSLLSFVFTTIFNRTELKTTAPDLLLPPRSCARCFLCVSLGLHTVFAGVSITQEVGCGVGNLSAFTQALCCW